MLVRTAMTARVYDVWPYVEELPEGVCSDSEVCLHDMLSAAVLSRLIYKASHTYMYHMEINSLGRLGSSFADK